jgi:quercetin dioxygenase-like cupin family protein
VSAFADLVEIAPHEIWAGVVGRVVAGEQVTFAVIELDPNTVVPEHAHENEQIGVLAAGSLRFRIGDEERDLESGGTWRIPPHVPHAVRTGPDGAVVVEVFAPPRADWAALARREPSSPAWPVPSGRL